MDTRPWPISHHQYTFTEDADCWRKRYIPRIGPSGLLARLPKAEEPTAGLVARDPCGVVPRDAPGGLSFNFLVLPLSLISPADPAPASTSLPGPGAPSAGFRIRFLPAFSNNLSALIGLRIGRSSRHLPELRREKSAEIWAAKVDVTAGVCSWPSSETCRCHSRPTRLVNPAAFEMWSTSSTHRCVWDGPTVCWCLWWASLILSGSFPRRPFVPLPSLVRPHYLRSSRRVKYVSTEPKETSGS